MFRFFILLMVTVTSFYSFGEQKVLDLGKIKIKGEIRRPTVDLVYSKKYFDKAVSVIAGKELKEFEKELLKPVKVVKTKKRK